MDSYWMNRTLSELSHRDNKGSGKHNSGVEISDQFVDCPLQGAEVSEEECFNCGYHNHETSSCEYDRS